MDLRRLRHFVELADSLNFRTAAGRVHLTQPAFSRSIAALERELGVRLFERDRRSVKLTAAGSALLDQARDLLRDADALERAAGLLGGGGPREIRVGVYGTALAELTHPVLQAFRDRHPDVRMTVRDVSFEHAVAPLLDGEIDVALLRAPTDVESITTVPLFTEPAAFQLPSSHPLSGAREVHPSELLGQSWAALPSTTPAEWQRYFVCAEDGGALAPSIGGHGRTIREIASLVAFNGLVSLVPSSTARQHHAGVRSVAAAEVKPFRVAALHRASSRNPLVESFIQIAMDVTRRHLSLVPDAEPLA